MLLNNAGNRQFIVPLHLLATQETQKWRLSHKCVLKLQLKMSGILFETVQMFECKQFHLTLCARMLQFCVDCSCLRPSRVPECFSAYAVLIGLPSLICLCKCLSNLSLKLIYYLLVLAANFFWTVIKRNLLSESTVFSTVDVISTELVLL